MKTAQSNYRPVALAGLALATSLVCFGASGQALNPLAIGAAAPMANHQVATVGDTQTSLNQERRDGGLMVVFTCNTCPWVEKWEDRYETISAAAREAGMGVLMLNSNAALRGADESMAAMKARSEKMEYSFPYAVDAESALADAFGATRTPEVYLFDQNMNLFYHGAIDDNAREAPQVESAFVLQALTAYRAGKPVPLAETNSIGCTIKRKRS